MFARNRSITFKITLDTSPSSQYKDGAHPIVIQLTHKRKVYHKRIGFKSFPDQWDNERYVSDRRIVRNYQDRNNELNELEDKMFVILNKHFATSFDYKKFSSLIDREEDTELTFQSVCDWYVDELYDQGRAGTATYYKDVGRSVANFEEGVYLSDITRHWIRDYVKYYTSRGVKPIAYLRGMKAIFNVALREYDLEFSIVPFKTAYNPKGYDISQVKKIKLIPKQLQYGKRIECLSESEIEILKDYKPTNEGKERAYDLFIFSYYTGGVNAKDIALMKYEDVIEDEWFYKREKTGEGGEGKPLTESAMKIIEKYRSNSSFVFPWILNKNISTEKEIKDRMSIFLSNLRRRYKAISKECGLNGYISFYTARPTAARTLVNRGANLKAVQTALDHSNISMTSQYIRRVEKSVMKETLEML